MAISYGTFTITDIQDITITSTSVTYQKNTSGTIKPTGTWLDTIPSVGEGEYLWTKTVVTYSDSSETESYSVSRNAINGTNGNTPTVVSTVTEYVQSDSGTSTPVSGWSTTPPTAEAGKYIWTKVTVNYSDGNPAISYSVVKNGINGIDGKDGGKWYSGTAMTGTSTTATVFSGSGITSAVIGDMYLNTTTYNTYRCTVAGAPSIAKWVYVNNIKGGIGDTGRGVSSIQNQYYLSTSNTEQTGGSWSNTMPSYAANHYYWTRSHIIWDDGSTPTDTTPVLDNALTDANANAIDARKVATNYLSVDNTGIMVADMRNGEQTPSNAVGRNVFIDNTSINIRDAVAPLAKFDANEIRVGKTNGNYMSVSSNSIDVYHNNEELVHFGYGQNQGESSVVTSPYFNLGGRKQNTTIGSYSVIEGNNVEASGWCSYAQGYGNVASAQCAHAEGRATTASGIISHSEGRETVASGDVSHAEGITTTASGAYSHAEGSNTVASSVGSHAEGGSTVASSVCSHAEGRGTIASSDYQHVQGQYNIADTNNKYAFIIGNGTKENDVITRSNAFTVEWNGDVETSGDINTNNLSINNNIAVTGNSTIGGTSTITGKLTANGSVDVVGDIGVTGDIDVTNGDISTTGNLNVNGTITGNSLPLLKTEAFYWNTTINANSAFTSYGFDVTQSGYTALGVVTFGVYDQSTSGRNSGWCVVPKCILWGGDTQTLDLYVWNQHPSQSAVVTVIVKVLYALPSII